MKFKIGKRILTSSALKPAEYTIILVAKTGCEVHCCLTIVADYSSAAKLQKTFQQIKHRVVHLWRMDSTYYYYYKTIWFRFKHSLKKVSRLLQSFHFAALQVA